MTGTDLTQEIIRLGPWHHDIEVVPGLRTGPGTDPQVSMLGDEWRDTVKSKLGRIYPEGLEGRTVLDCGCNCGECLLWAKELGAGRCYGFDLREHWIAQARFLLDHYDGPTEGIEVEVCGLYDLPKLDPLDITFFHGILYHLRDPMHGLSIASDLTREILFLNTAVKDGEDGMLVAAHENPDLLLAGEEELIWFPTGPGVVETMLRACGFVETQLLWQIPGRLEIVAAKSEGILP